MGGKATEAFSRRRLWTRERLKTREKYIKIIFIVFKGKPNKKEFFLFFSLGFGLLFPQYLTFLMLLSSELGFHEDKHFSFPLGLGIHEILSKDQMMLYELNDEAFASKVQYSSKLIMRLRINHSHLCLI